MLDDRQNPHVGHEVLDDAGFHVTDEAVDLDTYRWEDWIALALFATLAAIVFYQVFTQELHESPEVLKQFEEVGISFERFS